MKDTNLPKKMLEGKKTASQLKKRLNIPSPLKVIRDHCKDCGGGSPSEVKNCVMERCPLFPFRFGRSPKEADLRVPELDKYGRVIGYHDYSGYKF
jgi:hypothetical protein